MEKKRYTDLTRAVGLITNQEPKKKVVDAAPAATKQPEKDSSDHDDDDGDVDAVSPPTSVSSSPPFSTGRQRQGDTRGLPMYPLNTQVLVEYMA